MTSILLPAEYFKKLNPSYQKCILDLENELNQTLWYDNALKCEIIDKFSDKYLMPKEIWDKRIDLQSLEANDDPKAEYKKVKEKALTHFYSKRRHPRYYCDPNRKLLKAKFVPAIYPLYQELLITDGIEGQGESIYDKFDQKFIEYCLTFPHWRLERCFKEFDEISTSPFPKRVLKKYENVKLLYEKIKLFYDNLDQWFHCLLESEDHEFIVHNIEYRIGSDLTNKHLWKLYIQYLKDSKKYSDTVEVYSKYCKFFLDDIEMAKEYENAINEFKFIAVDLSSEITDDVKPSDIQIYNLQACQKSLHQNIFPQSFSFPTTLIRYILDNADPYILHYFYQTCKYFYHIHPKPLCHKLKAENIPQRFKGQSMDVTVRTLEPQRFKNFYITHSLEFFASSFNPCSTLSSLINNLYRCDAKFLQIGGQNLTIEEFKFLAGHGNVKYLFLYNVKIAHSDGTLISLEDVLTLTPKIYHFRLRRSYVNVNPKTTEIISRINFQDKFEVFCLSIASGELEPHEFCKFLKKNVVKEANIWINFQNPKPDYISNFSKILKENSSFNSVRIE